ncbi:MAG: leader peptide processing enzyme [Spirochaetaceae bacterium]|nr:leader peptide processing enzyme [Spirochaetaceae bacterium]MDT8297451.1 leader peptide processing enzyme [Spirochaetaceae bacterium]
MNKKLNTVIFLLGATVLNLLILATLAVLLGLLFGLAYRNIPEVSMALSWIAVIVILFGSIGGTFYFYSKIIKWIVKKWKIDDFIEPIFKSGRR